MNNYMKCQKGTIIGEFSESKEIALNCEFFIEEKYFFNTSIILNRS